MASVDHIPNQSARRRRRTVSMPLWPYVLAVLALMTLAALPAVATAQAATGRAPTIETRSP